MKKLKMYLCGGAVRDRLMGQEAADHDYTTPHSKEEIIKYAKANDFKFYVVNEKC